MIGLIITTLAAMYMKANTDIIARQEFTFICSDIKSKITGRMADHARVLRSSASFFVASRTVSRKEWHAFSAYQKLEQQLPGIQGIGFSLLIPKEQLDRHLQQIRAEGFPEYLVRPTGDREIYSSIIYLEPFSGRNLRAFGYDMLSEPVRRAAMEQARDSDTATLSGKVVLVQETGGVVQAGTLMFVPVYHTGMPTSTVEQRRAAIRGWVYSPYRMNDMMHGILIDENMQKNKQLDFHIYDGEQLSSNNLLYEYRPVQDNKTAQPSRFTQTIPVDFNGHRWTLLFTQAGRSPFSAEYINVWLTMVFGTVVSLLLFALFRSLITRAEAQRESELKYRTLANSGQALIWTAGTDKLCNYFNKVWLDFTGRTLEQELGNGWSEGVHPDDFQACLNTYNMAFDKREAFNMDYRLRRHDSEFRWIQDDGCPRYDTNGNFVGYIGSCLDITDHKLAEEALRESNAYLENLFNYANAPIIVWDPQFRITRFNHAFEFLTGRSVAEVLGQSLEILFPSSLAAHSMELIRKTVTGERWETVEIKILHRDESVRTVLWNSATLFAPDGITPIATIAQGQDITIRKQIENKLQEKNTELERFTYTVSHDLKSPLITIQTYAGMIVNDIESGNLVHAREDMKRIEGAASKMTNLLDDLLELSRVGKMMNAPAHVDMNRLVQDCLEQLAGPLNLMKIEVEVQPRLPGVIGDQHRIMEVLQNLIENAIKYRGDQVAPCIKIGTRENGIETVFFIGDNGAGIDPLHHEKIFDLFNKLDTRSQGTGVGLALVKRIVEVHGNRVWVESEGVGKGSCFCFTLPVAEKVCSEQSQSENGEIPGGRKR